MRRFWRLSGRQLDETVEGEGAFRRLPGRGRKVLSVNRLENHHFNQLTVNL